MARIGTLLSLLLLGAADAQAQNLVQNPGFDGGFGAWAVVGQHPTFWDEVMGNSAPGSAAISVLGFDPSTIAYVAYQCVPAAGGNTYDVGGSFRYPSGGYTFAVGSVQVTFYSNRYCAPPFSSSSSFQMSGPADTWATANYPGSLLPPSGTASMQLALVMVTYTTGAALGWFDDINLALTGGYFTVAPCRLVDTRVSGGALQGQESRILQIPGNCGIPATAKSISVNLAVTQPTAAGNVRLFPANQPVPTVSSINYGVGQTRANNAIIPLDPMGVINAFAGQPAGTTVHLILDVNGYFE